MKKLICLVLALVCCASLAMAESVPSKSTADMATAKVTAENMPAGAAFTVETTDNAATLATCQNEIEKLAASASVEAYFGEVKDSEGNVVSLAEILGATTLNVYEFLPVVASGYEEAYGKVTADFQFSTPYAQGEKVVVLIGIVENGAVAWTAFEGEGTGVNGSIQVELTAEIIAAIQAGTALLAVVSK